MLKAEYTRKINNSILIITPEKDFDDITSQRSLNQLLEFKSLDYAILQMILDSFDQACMQMEDFMLTENDIMMKPEYIFVDHNMEHVSYCYLPGLSAAASES